jgi:hypothetical protein
MPKTAPQETAIRTDTATLAVFDAQRLQHRLSDDPDWWSIPDDEVAEINAGNVLFVSMGVDGDYLVNVYRESPPPNVLPIAAQALIACDSGTVYVVAGEYVPSGDLQPETKHGGLFFDVPIGTYRVTVVHLVPYCLEVFVETADDKPANNFDDSPRIPWPDDAR